MSLNIHGLAAFHPNFEIDQKEAAKYAFPLSCVSEKQQRTLSALYARSRIRKRSSVLMQETEGRASYDFYRAPCNAEDMGPTTSARMEKYEKFAGQLAVSVCRQALDRADLRGGEITHLVTVTCTGFYAPGFDFQIFRELGLPDSVQRTQVGFMGCQAALNALRVAAAFAESNQKARILICSVELCSLHFQYGWNPDRVVSNALFADGAGAIVGVGDQAGNLKGKHWRVNGTGSKLLPDSGDAMTWRIGDNGFVMTLSPRIPELIQRLLPEWIDGWLARFSLSRNRVASWAVHPGGTRILRAVEEALDLSEASTAISHQVLTEHGNMSSATMIYILEKLVARRAPRPCVALGFGPGLTVEGVLLE